MLIPQYRLRTVNGTYIQNQDYEFTEQQELVKRVKDGDRILQLGGNIGTSCITAGKAADLASNVCVEPSLAVLPTLRRNVNEHGSLAQVVEGIVAECRTPISLQGVGQDAENNDWGAHIVNSQEGQPVTCHSLRSVSPHDGFTILFADCEGCFDTFIQTYATELHQHHPLHTIIYEKDGQSDYAHVNAFTEEHGFTCTGSFHQVCTRPVA
jgi:FkbM family methyltransferase